MKNLFVENVLVFSTIYFIQINTSFSQHYFGIHDIFNTKENISIVSGFSSTRLNGDYLTTWRTIEPSYGNYFFFNDSLLKIISSNRLVIAPLGTTPIWASSNPDAKPYPNASHWFGPYGYLPKDMAHWRSYVKTVTTHYKNYVDVWEIWNEPDIHFLIADSAGKNKNYERLIEHTVNALSEMPERPLLAGPSFAYYLTKDPVKPPGKFPPELYSRYRDTSFVARFMNSGSGHHLDIFTFHHYSTISNPLPEFKVLKEKIAHIYERFPSIKEVWVTEFNVIKPWTWSDSLTQIAIGHQVVREHLELLAAGVDKIFIYNAFNKPYGKDSYSNLIVDNRETHIFRLYKEMVKWFHLTGFHGKVLRNETDDFLKYVGTHSDYSILVAKRDAWFRPDGRTKITSPDGQTTENNGETTVFVPAGQYFFLERLTLHE